MQRAFATLDTDGLSTIAKAMEKRREIPAKPNAAPKSDVERVRGRIDNLGVDFHDAVKQAGLAYATGYRFLKGEASVASLRTLEEWVVKEERRRKLPPVPTGEQQDAAQAEWAEIGRELARLDPEHFETVLRGLRDVVEASKLTQRAFRSIFRATPDSDR